MRKSSRVRPSRALRKLVSARRLGLCLDGVCPRLGQGGARPLLFAPDQYGAGGQTDDAHQQEYRGGADGGLVPPRQPGGPLPRRRPAGVDRLVLAEASQVVGQLLGGSVAVLGPLGRRLEHDRLQRHGDGPVDPPGGPRLFKGDLPQQLLAVLAVKRRPQRQQFVQRDAQRVDVAAVVQRHAPGQGLLGAHVAQRADQVAGLR
jgi:hypothetical protein